MVLNAAVQMLREAEELKQKILKFKSGTSMIQERGLWVTQQQLQKVYQKVLVLDLDYALDKKVEQDLWNMGFKQQIEALQAISKDKKNPKRSEGQAMLAWVLQAAAGFYLCLLHQICTTFQLDLPFRRRASLLGWVEGWGASGGETTAGRVSLPPPAAARYICQHCLVHLGDLARYRQQLRVAHTFYRHALLVSAHSGQPYNQLALVCWRRGARLSSLYWHVRSLLVRAPFPPAPNNLARTLAAAARNRDSEKDLPVIPGITAPKTECWPGDGDCAGSRLDAHNYVDELIRALHFIHTLDNLDAASKLVDSLNKSLAPLVAEDSFECMTLVKQACVLIWLVHSCTEGLLVDASHMTPQEADATSLAHRLVLGAIVAVSLTCCRKSSRRSSAMPPLKVWLQWLDAHPRLLSLAVYACPLLWAALTRLLNNLEEYTSGFDGLLYATIPLPEDEELNGFLPLEQSFATLKFSNYASWDTYGDRIPDPGDADLTAQDDQTHCIRSPSDVTEETLSKQPDLEHKIRAYRLVRIASSLATHVQNAGHDYFSVAIEEETRKFTSRSDERELCAALSELCADDSDEEETVAPPAPPAPPPIIISEADFREKVREKRVGILKPQGSLERAREERAMASNTQDDQESESTEDAVAKGEESKKEARKLRMNVAMAAIMRKQEETNKQVKFVTPATTPDSQADSSESSSAKELPKESIKDQEKLKIIQPKAMKSLANLPIGRKTGGILSLKDKSAGYPHLVNAELEAAKIKTEKDDKSQETVASSSSQHSQTNSYNAKPRQEPHPASPPWPNSPANNFNAAPRMGFSPKPYGLQNPGLNFNPTYQQQPNLFGANNQGLRLAVVNPKEIDVRTAALQKQNSKHDLFQNGPKFGHMSSDKKNFLKDLPPRFANQYRYWQQNTNDNQFNQDNKFRDDNFENANFGNFASNPPPWTANQVPQETYPQQQMSWWKPDNNLMSNFNNYSTPPIQPNFYPQQVSTVGNPYQSLNNFNKVSTESDGLNPIQPNYLHSTIGQPPLQHNMASLPSTNYNSVLNNYSNYGQPVMYDTNMYPQFSNNKLNYPPPMTASDKTVGPYHQEKPVSFGAAPGMIGDLQHANVNFSSDVNSVNNMDRSKPSESSGSEMGGNTYSLFSGARDNTAWGPAHHTGQQSLWSGPGPSPLERLLEQQKKLKYPTSEPQ